MARILIVDDDADIRKVAERVLTAAQHEVYLADNALIAMDMLNASTFDVLISDANMPHYTGFDLVQTVRNNRRFNNMAVAMLTGLRERKDIERAIRAGVDDYIVKPIDPLLFLKKVESLFDKRPPQERAELQMPETSSYSEASIIHKVRVTWVSELGLVLESSQKFREGSVIDVQAPVFEQIGVKCPPLRVLAVKELKSDTWELRVGFIGATESLLQKIRAWVYAETTKRRTG